jgi:hypothetical protein
MRGGSYNSILAKALLVLSVVQSSLVFFRRSKRRSSWFCKSQTKLSTQTEILSFWTTEGTCEAEVYPGGGQVMLIFNMTDEDWYPGYHLV